MKAFATEVNERVDNALGPAIMAPLRPNRGSIHRGSAMNHGLHQNLQLFSAFANLGCWLSSGRGPIYAPSTAVALRRRPAAFSSSWMWVGPSKAKSCVDYWIFRYPGCLTLLEGREARTAVSLRSAWP